MLNARSVVNKWSEIKIDIIDHRKPCIIAVTETWLHPSIDANFLCVNNYICFRSDRIQAIGGGAALLIRHELMPSIVDNYSFSDSLNHLNLIVCDLHRLRYNGKKIRMCLLYCPPSATIDNLRSLRSVLFKLADVQNREVIILETLIFQM